MGATGWKYWVSYEADVSKALKRLRENIFSRGLFLRQITASKSDYETALKKLGSDSESELKYFAALAANTDLTEQLRNKYAQLVQQLKKLKNSDKDSAKPATIDELLTQTGEMGTHSILDMICISEKRRFGGITAMPKVELENVFNNETPSHREIEKKYSENAFERYVTRPWHGIYIVAYKKGQPNEIFFAGCSGD